jgi:hypothetical protein
MELMLFTCARSIHINTDRKQLKQVLHFRFSFEPRFSEVDKSLFLVPPLHTTSCNVHYSGSILYDNKRETWSKSSMRGGLDSVFQATNVRQFIVLKNKLCCSTLNSFEMKQISSQTLRSPDFATER